jgi:hypothetical protein
MHLNFAVPWTKANRMALHTGPVSLDSFNDCSSGAWDRFKRVDGRTRPELRHFDRVRPVVSAGLQDDRVRWDKTTDVGVRDRIPMSNVS